MALTASLAAAVLVAGLTTTHSFADTAGPGREGTTPLATAERSGTTAGLRWVTLITGDRVGVDPRGRAASFQPAEGREKIPVRSYTDNGRTFVVPADAERLIGKDVLDRRLFDITGLSAPESRRAHSKGLRVIVAYEGAAATARKGVRSDAEVRRTLPALNADALTIPQRDAGALWAALTRTAGTEGARTAGAVPGIDRVWLDSVRTATLDKSVAQIGAPKAWQAGYDGKGVTIAVLDTGVDETHADLRGQVVGAKNFTRSPDTTDRNGHGTHVASTAAGTGAHSGGTHKGVAPGAKILNAKVLDDAGFGSDSEILAGMDWAVAQGADVVNMSLGGLDTPEVDPLEALVDKLSKEKGVLFAVAAGNAGPGARTVGSPGSADSALTVGAVDDADGLAPFSSRGPRVGDSGVKPDVTAPGVGIVAAAASGTGNGADLPGYVSMNGTSMATPHVAGAAALLKQRHPTWSGERIKSVLAASAKDGGHGVFQQGSGRIEADRALQQTVTADENTLSFGLQRWPHTDDTPVTKQVTYRNLGDRDATLNLTVQGLDPQGRPAPAGFFTVGATEVTVPAGRTATVPVTTDTRIGGTTEGIYTATVTATGGGQSVRTTAAVNREAESYDLTLNHLGRDGKPSTDYQSLLLPLAGTSDDDLIEVNGRSTATYRLPKGDYFLDAFRVVRGPDPSRMEVDRLAHPRLALTKDTVVDVDARLAKPVSLTVPDTAAPQTRAVATLSVDKGGKPARFATLLDSFDVLRTAQLGPAQPTGSTVRESFQAQWTAATTEYSAIAVNPGKSLSTGFSHAFKTGDFAEVAVTTTVTTPAKRAFALIRNELSGVLYSSYASTGAPGTRTVRLATSGAPNRWSVGAAQLDAHESLEIEYMGPERKYRPGANHRETIGTGVHSPLLNAESGVFRAGDTLIGLVPMFSDGRGNAGSSLYNAATTTLHRGTTKIGENQDPMTGWEGFEVGADDAEYTLATTVRRDPSYSRISTGIDASWTFRSAKLPTDETTRIALSTVRFGAPVAPDGTVPADRTSTFPLTVQGPAAGRGLASLTAAVSYDDGRTWQDTPVTQGRITVKNPARDKAVSLRAQVTDARGGKASVTVHNAYFGK
ncbi:S8 family serine peptidase [Streptomyces sp. NPDC058953]|uniref:S8 family peptidase n=1 Tax=unclassified Streptomyces TaxID=2593676 RepID=UPI0036C58EE1